MGCSKYVWNGYAVADANEPFAADIRLPFTARDAPILVDPEIPSEPILTKTKTLLADEDGVIDTLKFDTVTYAF